MIDITNQNKKNILEKSVLLIITQKQLDILLKNLKKNFDFFDCRNHALGFKQYFLPPEEEIFQDDGKKIKSSKKPKIFILYGLNFLELEALTQLDNIMRKPYKDYFYFQKRKQAIVIGLIKEEIDTAPGGDIVFQKINKKNYYKVLINSKKAEKLINQKLFTEIKITEKLDPQIPQGKSLNQWQKNMRKLLLDPEILAETVARSQDNKIWAELAKKCLGCANCTYICPLCYCFSIQDRIKLDNKKVRIRKWASCILTDFAEISGGYNFKSSLKQRYYNLFYHKFVRGYKEYGKSLCVGCGKCKDICPAEIDILETLKCLFKFINK